MLESWQLAAIFDASREITREWIRQVGCTVARTLFLLGASEPEMVITFPESSAVIREKDLIVGESLSMGSQAIANIVCDLSFRFIGTA